jgi:H+/gluconate symporter-like permease
MGLFGILLGLALLVWLAYRGWSILLLAPGAGLIAAAFAGGPLLAYWTQTFMDSASRFVAQFFPLFLLGALFGKLMEDSGSVATIARFMTEWLGPARAILTVVLAGALVTYGGVSLFVAFFVIAPMAQNLFRSAGIPRRLMPAAIMLGTSTFTMSAMPGTPSIQNTIPMPFFGTTPFAAPGLGIIASLIMLGFGLWWLQREEATAKAQATGLEKAPRGRPSVSPKTKPCANARRRRANSIRLRLSTERLPRRSRLSRPPPRRSSSSFWSTLRSPSSFSRGSI